MEEMARPRRKEREMLELIQAAIYAGVNVVIVLLLLIPVLVMAAVSVLYLLFNLYERLRGRSQLQ